MPRRFHTVEELVFRQCVISRHCRVTAFAYCSARHPWRARRQFFKEIATIQVGSLLHCVGRTFLAPARKVPKNRHGEALEPAAIQAFHVLLLPTPPQSRPPHDPSRHAARRRDSVVVVFIEGNRSDKLKFLIIFIKFDKFFLAKAARIPHHETDHHRGTIRVSVPGESQERGRLENRAWQ